MKKIFLFAFMLTASVMCFADNETGNDGTPVETVEQQTVTPVQYTSITGVVFTEKPTAKGIYIVKYSDGSIRKVVVK